MFWPLYTEVAFVERLFCTQTVHLGPGPGAWPLQFFIATGLYSEVVVNMQRFHCITYIHNYIDTNV